METITMSYEEYLSMREQCDFLAALGAAGVDNWEGFSVARRILEGDFDDE